MTVFLPAICPQKCRKMPMNAYKVVIPPVYAIAAMPDGTRLHGTFMQDGNKYDNTRKKYLL